MLYELISEFAKWLSKADETQINNGKVFLVCDFLVIDIAFCNDKISIENIFDIHNNRTLSFDELDMDINLFFEITSKLLKNRKKELQKQRIIELSNEEPYK